MPCAVQLRASLTVDEAYDCLLVKEDGAVHSFENGFPGHFFGAALTNERVRELLGRAKDRNSLILLKKAFWTIMSKHGMKRQKSVFI